MARIPFEIKLKDLRNLQQIDSKISDAISSYDGSLKNREEALKNEIKGSFSETISGIEDYINDDLAEQLNNLNGGLDGLQKQLDGEVNAWFRLEYPIYVENDIEYVNLEVLPIAEWIGDNYYRVSDNNYELKEGCKNELINHIGDTYTNLEEFVSEEETPLAGKSWRWCDATSMIEANRMSSEACIHVKYTKDEEEKEVYLHWHLITDSDALRALELAKGAQSTADGKSTIFISIDQEGDRAPNNYKIGDMWILNDFALTYSGSGFGQDNITSGDTVITKYYYIENNEKVYVTSGEILTANKNNTYYSLTDWSKQVKYTDDTIANKALDDATDAKRLADSAKQEAESARDRLEKWSEDGVISPLETQGIKDELKRIKSDLDHVVSEYNKYGQILSGVTGLTVDLPADFDVNNTDGAYYKYHDDLQNKILDGTKNEDGSVNIPEGFADHQTDYYSARTKALEDISNFSDCIVDVYIETSINSGKIKTAISGLEDKLNRTLGSEIAKLNGGLEGLQQQLDGEVSSYFLMGAPVVIENKISKVRIDVEPMKTWLLNYEQEETTGIYTLKADCKNELINNIGDTYTNNDEFISEEETPLAGKSWRWCDATDAVNTGQTSSEECIHVKYTKDEEEKEVYLHWYLITDSDALRALELAKGAQSTADGKSTIFISIDQEGDRVPNNYKIGDLWILNDFALNYEESGFSKKTITSGDTELTKYYYTENDKSVYVTSGDILTANEESDVYELTHWSKSVKYTDDTVASQALSDAANANILAASANTIAEAAQDRLNNWSADGVISPLEMQGIKDELKRIKSDLDHIVAEYNKYSGILSDVTGLTVDLPADFDVNNTDGAYYKYHDDLQNKILDGTKNEDGSVNIPEGFADHQEAYYSARTEALINISILADAYANVMVKNESDGLARTFEADIKRIEDYINEDLASQIEKLNGGLDGLQKQLDGEVNAWFKPEYPIENGKPVLNIEPIKDWIGTNYELIDGIYVLKEGGKNELINHIGDTYTNNEDFVSEEETPLAGKSWRWCDATSMISKIPSDECIRVKYTKDNVEKEVYLHWHIITDSDALRALELAKSAQSTADGKSTIYISINQDGDRVPNNYKIGDLWILNDLALEYGEFDEDQVYTVGDILTANKAMVEKYKASDWSKEVKYTDDTKADEAYNVAQSAQTTANNAQLDAQQAQQNLTNYVSDKRIDATEMEFLLSELEEFKAEKIRIVGEDGNGGEASNWEASVSPTDYITAYNVVVETIKYYTDVNSTEYETNKYIKIIDNTTGETSYKNWSNLSNYYTERQKILNDIASASKSYSDSIKTTAEKADEAAQSAQTMAQVAQESADIALTQLGAIDDDSIVSISEFNILETQLKEMDAEIQGIISMASKYDIDVSEFMDAYICAITAIKYHTGKVYDNFDNVAPFKYADDNNTIALGIEIVTDTSKDYAYQNISSYYTARQIILNTITAAAEAVAKKYTDDKAEEIGEEIVDIRTNISGMTQEIASELSDIAKRYGDLQRQIDGEVTSWFMAGEPEVHCAPSNEWIDEDTKKKHEGDTYTNINSSGKEYKPFDVDFWEQGTISPLIKDEISGRPYSEIKALSSTSIRTKKMLKLEELSYGRITSDNLEYNFHVVFYDNNKKVSNYVYGNAVPIEDNGNFSYFSIVAEKATNEEITTEEVENFKFKYKVNEVTYVWAKYVDETAGQSWRWCECLHYNEIGEQVNGWHWHKIADSDAVKALTEAAKAQFAADGKCKTFIQQPSNYQSGDIWVLQSNSDHTLGKKGYILIADQASVTYNANHWKNYVQYTDDTAANAAQQKADNATAAAENAKKNADIAKAQLDAIDDDNVISKTEFATLETQLEQIESEHKKIVSDCELYGIDLNENISITLDPPINNYSSVSRTYNESYNYAVSALKYHCGKPYNDDGDIAPFKYLTDEDNNIILDENGNEVWVGIDIVSSLWRTYGYNHIKVYYECRQYILNKIANKAKEYAESYAKDVSKIEKFKGVNLCSYKKILDSGFTYVSGLQSDGSFKIAHGTLHAESTNPNNKDMFGMEGEYIENTQYTCTLHNITTNTTSGTALYFIVQYSDSTRDDIEIPYDSTTFSFTTRENKTILKIRGTYINGAYTISQVKLEVGDTATPYIMSQEDKEYLVNKEILEAQQAVSSLNESLTDTEDLLNKSLEDGFIDNNEKEALRKSIEQIKNDFNNLKSEYDDVMGSGYLLDLTKQRLEELMLGLKQTYMKNYIDNINTIININSKISVFKPKIEITSEIPNWTFENNYNTPKTIFYKKISEFSNLLKAAQQEIRVAIAKEAQQYANAAVSGIEVGGTNLIRNSKINSIDSFWSDSRGTLSLENNALKCIADDVWRRIYNPQFKGYNFDFGNQYTLSLDIRTNDAKTRRISICNDNSSIVILNFGDVPTSTEWTRVSSVATATQGDVNHSTIGLYIFASTWGAYTSGDFVEIRNIKLEKGNIATAWTPAPEDINSEIEEAKKEAKEVSSALNSTESLLNKSLEDGYIDANEKEALNKALATLTIEMSGLTKEHNDVYGSIYLTSSQKETLETAYDTLNTKHSNYDSAIRAIMDITISGLTLVKPKIQISGWSDAKYKTPKSEYEEALTKYLSALSTAQTQMRANLDAETKKNINEAIDNIQVGGTNILPHTQSFIDNNALSGDGRLISEKYNNFGVRYLDMTSIATTAQKIVAAWNVINSATNNDEFTCSFYAKGSGQVHVFLYSNSYNGLYVIKTITSQGGTWTSVDGKSIITLTDTWTRYWITWKLGNPTSIVTRQNNLLFRLYGGNEMFLCGCQLEKGNKATAWKPNDADIIEANENILKGSMLIDLGSDQLQKSITKKLKKNTEYVFSVESCSDDADLYLFDQEGENLLTQLECAKSEKKYITFLTPNSENTNVYLAVNYAKTISNNTESGGSGSGSDSSNTSVTVTFYGVKLAEGNKYTPWEGTPEEQQTIMTLNNAMQGSTETKGGLMLTNVIGMKGSVNGTGNDVTAGINGLDTKDVNGMPSDLRFWAGSTSWGDIHTAPFRVYEDGRVFGTHFYGYLSPTIINSSNASTYIEDNAINLMKTGQIIVLDRSLKSSYNGKLKLKIPNLSDYIGTTVEIYNPDCVLFDYEFAFDNTLIKAFKNSGGTTTTGATKTIDNIYEGCAYKTSSSAITTNIIAPITYYLDSSDKSSSSWDIKYYSGGTETVTSTGTTTRPYFTARRTFSSSYNPTQADYDSQTYGYLKMKLLVTPYIRFNNTPNPEKTGFLTRIGDGIISGGYKYYQYVFWVIEDQKYKSNKSNIIITNISWST